MPTAIFYFKLKTNAEAIMSTTIFYLKLERYTYIGESTSITHNCSI
jgi:hypothetical protein